MPRSRMSVHGADAPPRAARTLRKSNPTYIFWIPARHRSRGQAFGGNDLRGRRRNANFPRLRNITK